MKWRNPRTRGQTPGYIGHVAQMLRRVRHHPPKYFSRWYDRPDKAKYLYWRDHPEYEV